jgi:hypothetical protein
LVGVGLGPAEVLLGFASGLPRFDVADLRDDGLADGVDAGADSLAPVLCGGFGDEVIDLRLLLAADLGGFEFLSQTLDLADLCLCSETISLFLRRCDSRQHVRDERR